MFRGNIYPKVKRLFHFPALYILNNQFKEMFS
ncbi:hypothetical protein EC153152_04081 [Escherichia coli O145:H28]|nr:hypothetical protein EC142095_04383 [Escherichia coli O145:H28]GEE92889.1 hypothetical protein EC14744_02859 [Escherichia coli O145:H28]GEG20804.1 hypothetical protein EC153152_04081 [Escherichia coli O145:H28]GEG81624.1 hypothetical protein EC160509_04144 [Escherichia coli O145:H28]GEH39108.1 hypothetical protein EC150952_04125 [Escherichia coli O145:H28]